MVGEHPVDVHVEVAADQARDRLGERDPSERRRDRDESLRPAREYLEPQREVMIGPDLVGEELDEVRANDAELLAEVEGVPHLADGGLVAVRQVLDELVGVGELGRLDDAGQGRYPSMRAAGLVLITALTLGSLLIFNRENSWDETAFYFFGSFGLGVLVYWASSRKNSTLWFLLLSMLVMAALLVDFRSRVAVAGIVMLLLGLARQFSPLMKNLPLPNFLTALGRISYSVFLVHFPLCLLVNTAFFYFFPAEPAMNALGLILAIGVSIYGGALFFRWVESRPLTQVLPRFHGRFG